MALEKVQGELQDVGATLAQRGHPNVDAAQAIEQIGPKQPLLDQGRQAAVGRGDDPDVHPAGRVTADALDGEILNRTKQLGLGRDGEIGDLVEKQRPAFGDLELSPPAADAGRRPFLDPEQLRLEQGLDQRRAVDRDERPVAPPAQLVDLTRDQFLADTALALEQDGEIGRGDPLDRRAQGLHHLSRPDQWRRAVATWPGRVEQPGPRELEAGSLDLQNQRAHVRGGGQHLEVPVSQPASRVECHFEHAETRGVGARHFEGDRLGAARRAAAAPPASDLAQMDAPHGNDLPERGLERAAHQRHVEPSIQRPRQRGQHLGDRLSTIPLPRNVIRHGVHRTKRDATARRPPDVRKPATFDHFDRHVI